MNNSYKIIKKLGKGHFGEIMLAVKIENDVNAKLDNYVAIKQLYKKGIKPAE